MLEAKNAEKNKIIMALADELLLSSSDCGLRPEFARRIDSVSACAGYAPDFNCATVRRYLDGGMESCSSAEKVGVGGYPASQFDFCQLFPLNIAQKKPTHYVLINRFTV